MDKIDKKTVSAQTLHDKKVEVDEKVLKDLGIKEHK